MFDLSHLRITRLWEIRRIARYLPAAGQVLEIGAGTGEQARWLTKRGFRVVAIDVPSSNYASHKVFPVIEYDGSRIPFPDHTFDCIFSSNVLEHVRDLDGLFGECRRVLRPSGSMVHVMPTPAWRVWSILVQWLDAPVSAWKRLVDTKNPYVALRRWIGQSIPRRHGERGNVITEVWLYHPKCWKKVFERNGWMITQAESLQLFYTGNMLLGHRLGLLWRHRLSRVLGNPVCLYLVQPVRAVRDHAAV